MQYSRLFLLTVVVSSPLLMTFLCGCASKLLVTYNSDPPCASIYEGGRLIGMAPVILSYDVTDENKKVGVMNLSPVTARWVSGAQCDTGSIKADINRYGNKQSLTLVRPAGAPNVQADADYAVGMQGNALTREQMDRAQTTEALNMINNFNQQNKLKSK